MKAFEAKVKRDAVVGVLERITKADQSTRNELFAGAMQICTMDWQKSVLGRLAKSGLIEKVPGTAGRNTKWRAVDGSVSSISRCLEDPRLLTIALRGASVNEAPADDDDDDAVPSAWREAGDLHMGNGSRASMSIETSDEPAIDAPVRHPPPVLSMHPEEDGQDIETDFTSGDVPPPEEMIAAILKLSYANVHNIVEVRKQVAHLEKKLSEALEILRTLL